MRQLEEGKDRFNATMYVGSNALFRRTALEEIGGFATELLLKIWRLACYFKQISGNCICQ